MRMDKALCKGDDCGKKERCERFTFKSNSKNQLYFYTSPIESGECDFFTENLKIGVDDNG
jgi:hypothetical protein